MSREAKKISTSVRRYGPAELYGQAVPDIPSERIRALAAAPCGSQSCPFKPNGSLCTKKGGVCSLGLFERCAGAEVRLVGSPVTTCPHRFLEGGEVFSWAGEILLGAPAPVVVREIPFLMAKSGRENVRGEEVGRIDHVVVRAEEKDLSWGALEMQAVYFSGAKLEEDLAVLREWHGPGIPMPLKHRRPDFRSSGPKRLMPQLQTKVPTLRRWGKKMAVVVDRHFWDALGEIRSTHDLSNADLVWLVVDYVGPMEGRYLLRRHTAVLTTLENAIEGLTGGTPVSLEQFERSILQKLARLAAT